MILRFPKPPGNQIAHLLTRVWTEMRVRGHKRDRRSSLKMLSMGEVLVGSRNPGEARMGAHHRRLRGTPARRLLRAPSWCSPSLMRCVERDIDFMDKLLRVGTSSSG